MYRCLVFLVSSKAAENLALPNRFSTTTSKAIRTGVLSKSAHVKIVHCPTPHDLDTISRRLIKKHPKLKLSYDK